jgi:hypothetical protein
MCPVLGCPVADADAAHRVLADVLSTLSRSYG